MSDEITTRETEEELEKVCRHAEKVGVGSIRVCTAQFNCIYIKEIGEIKYCLIEQQT